MIETTYTCDLCRRKLDPVTPAGRYPEGWALSWTGAGRAEPAPGSQLEPIRKWDESPVHLCQVCVEAVHRFHEAAASVGEIEPVAEGTP